MHASHFTSTAPAMDLECGVVLPAAAEGEVFFDARSVPPPTSTTTTTTKLGRVGSIDSSTSTTASSSAALGFRPIRATDRDTIQRLHEEWFPVHYQEEFYEDLCCQHKMCHTGDDLYTELAVVPRRHPPSQQIYNYCHNQHYQTTPAASSSSASSQSSSASPMPAPPPGEPWSRPVHDAGPPDDEIVACIVAAPISASKLNPPSRRLLLPEYHHYRERLILQRQHHPGGRPPPPPRHSRLCYVMTLGTVIEYRQEGLATRLIERCINNVVKPDPSCGALYLHVITSNQKAIRFYEGLGFWRVEEIPDYYTIDGEHHNCYLYAKYFHGNRGHLDLITVVSQWVSSAWRRLRGPLLGLLRSSYYYYYHHHPPAPIAHGSAASALPEHDE